MGILDDFIDGLDTEPTNKQQPGQTTQGQPEKVTGRFDGNYSEEFLKKAKGDR